MAATNTEDHLPGIMKDCRKCTSVNRFDNIQEKIALLFTCKLHELMVNVYIATQIFGGLKANSKPTCFSRIKAI